MFARTATKLLIALALCGALSAIAQTKINANQINGIATVSGTPAVGDLLYGTSATTFGLLPDVALGSCLISGGVTTAPSWGSCGSAGALSSVTAATGAHTIASGNNTGQIWNWANTTDSTVAFTFGETSAATGGTSTSNVPNQVLAKFTTLAASTQSPWAVYSRGTFVAAVSPTTAQLIAGGVTADCTAPGYAVATNLASGMHGSGNNIVLCANGSTIFSGGSGQANFTAGTSTVPGLSDTSQGVSGFSFNVSTAANLDVLYNSKDVFRVNAGGHLNAISQSSGVVNLPTISACGTTTSVIGTDNAMDVTTGATGAPTVCTVNFGTTWITNAPICVVSTNTVADAAIAVTATSTTQVTITKGSAFTASSHLYIQCMGRL